jgi:hypothetical protein
MFAFNTNTPDQLPERASGRSWGFKPLDFQYQQMPLTYRSASHHNSAHCCGRRLPST